MTIEDIAVYGVMWLAGLTLLWVIYHAGRADAEAEQRLRDMAAALEIRKKHDELKEQSHEAAESALDAGANAGPAPVDAGSLPDSVRARIFRRRG